MKIDAWIIRWIEAGYLWLFDRTGVMVGSLMTVSMLVSIFIMKAPLVWKAVLIALLMWTTWEYYEDQAKERYKKFNDRARYNQDGWWRLIVMGFTVGGTVQHLGDYLYHFSDLTFWVWIWLSCVQVRERQPPEKHQFATQGAGS